MMKTRGVAITSLAFLLGFVVGQGFTKSVLSTRLRNMHKLANSLDEMIQPAGGWLVRATSDYMARGDIEEAFGIEAKEEP